MPRPIDRKPVHNRPNSYGHYNQSTPTELFQYTGPPATLAPRFWPPQNQILLHLEKHVSKHIASLTPKRHNNEQYNVHF